MVRDNERKLIEELKELRFLDCEEDEDEDKMEEEVLEKIQRYEEIICELSLEAGTSIIPELCGIAEDDAIQQSSVDYLMRKVLTIARKDKEKGIKKIIEGTKNMLPKAVQNALQLHIWIIRDKDLKEEYIKALKTAPHEEKVIVIKVLKEIIDDEDEWGVKEILDRI